ncbi:uncharacterized protein EAE98_000628 [Botrytis deweyae]|uniref:Uncharacterized protein n=1 Tax=Botrytis deweyae TaxID=2478750 RepID=A0ABQ7J384_9HELO|nr:uncharacterized protein EAE98_000628 [Botrytis deweyae]KAF7940501.1 hypothetical protein EAE98_000628 [Botrytis deweyae]
MGSKQSTARKVPSAINVISSTLSPAAINKPKTVVSGGLDSGYASQSTSPDILTSLADYSIASGEISCPHFSGKSKQLRTYKKQIPQLTLERFSDLREQYAETLNEFTRGLPGCSSVLMSLKVLGEDEQSAEPWIFIQCDKAISKKVKDFFKQPIIKIDFEPLQPDDRSPRLRVLVCPLRPRPLAKYLRSFAKYLDPRRHDAQRNDHQQHGPLTNRISTPIYSRIDARFCGRTICGMQVMNGSSHEVQQATIRGNIQVVDKNGKSKLYGMTAGHFLFPELYGNDEQGTADDLSDESTEEDFQLELGSINDSLGGKTQPLGKGARSARRGSICKSRIIGNLSDPSHTSFGNERNLDWALISFSQPYYDRLPNLYQKKELCQHKYLAGIGGDTFSRPEITVALLTAHGPQSGLMSSSFSYIMQPPGKVLIRTYLLSFPDCEHALHPGDSGAWVINLTSLEVYGHIIASDVFGRGYVVPIGDLLDDIKTHLSADSKGVSATRGNTL